MCFWCKVQSERSRISGLEQGVRDLGFWGLDFNNLNPKKRRQENADIVEVSCDPDRVAVQGRLSTPRVQGLGIVGFGFGSLGV